MFSKHKPLEVIKTCGLLWNKSWSARHHSLFYNTWGLSEPISGPTRPRRKQLSSSLFVARTMAVKGDQNFWTLNVILSGGRNRAHVFGRHFGERVSCIANSHFIL